MNQSSRIIERTDVAKKSAVEQFLLRHQQWVIGLVVMPASYVHHQYGQLKKLFTPLRAGRVPQKAELASEHLRKVERVCQSVRQWLTIPEDSRPHLRSDRLSAASHSVRTVDKSGSYIIPMRDFNRILDVDLEEGTVTVEPNVTVGELTSHLLKQNRMLEATLEMEDATLGGLALSQGMTTHSHRCGLVHDTVVRYEFVTGTGECVDATEQENPDLYNSAGFSHGTLGFLTALELKIVPAGRELLVSYQHLDSVQALHAAYRYAITETDAFFLEAIIYSPDHAVLIRGDLLTAALRQKELTMGTRTNFQGRWYKTWFFRYAEKVPDGHREFMPMRDYLMRHDRSLCMTMLYVFPAANHPLMRWLLGWMLPPKVSFLKALRPPQARLDAAREQIYQDLAFPMDRLESFVRYIDQHIGIYPLLVYPCKVTDRGGFLKTPSGEREQYFLNLGIYGVPAPIAKGDSQYNVIAETRKLLGRLRDAGGFQHSYCDVFQTREEFETMFNTRLADKVRMQLHTHSWMNVYDKVQPEIPWRDWV